MNFSKSEHIGLDSFCNETQLPVERLDEHFPQLEEELGGRAIYLVRTDMNVSGTFKWRGALRATEREFAKGTKVLSTASAGNHARGLMVAARKYDLAVNIVVPKFAPPQKSSELHAFWTELGGDPADLYLKRRGRTFDDAFEYASSQSYSDEMSFIHPFDDEDVIAGQGEHLKDILESLPGVSRTVSATGGGGLAAGLQSANVSFGSPLITHFVEASGSNSLSRTLESGSIDPIVATNPNIRYGGIAVSKVGAHVVKTLWQSLYDHKHMVTGYDGGVTELARMYTEIDPDVIRLEPTALIAVEGLRELIRQNRLGQKEIVAVLATGHNESPEALLTDTTWKLKLASGYADFTPPSKR